MLTTIDNPWNPFKHFKEWMAFDRSMGYGTLERLGRLRFSSDNLGDAERDRDNELAIQMVIDSDILGIYMKVSEDTDIKPIAMKDYLEMIGVDTDDIYDDAYIPEDEELDDSEDED